jgi:hypothetical protein
MEGAIRNPVCGELPTFEGPETYHLTIDWLEGVHPGGPCRYRAIRPGDRWWGVAGLGASKS